MNSDAVRINNCAWFVGKAAARGATVGKGRNAEGLQ